MVKLTAAMDLAVGHAEGKISAERYVAASLALTRSAYEDARTIKSGNAMHLERRSDAESDGLFTEAERQKLDTRQSLQRERQQNRRGGGDNTNNFRGRSRSRSRPKFVPRQEQQQKQRSGRQRQMRRVDPPSLVAHTERERGGASLRVPQRKFGARRNIVTSGL
eukprot:TRINITY_DN19132_c0_g1_i3.p1 TRINITY_DN19132_c0_g1~~TRINITY_DN19132_c0_g1_i3.p1  ORF type:complete len:164 (-),score=14.22 TRINITY_DN19132_c0_g1_i3:1-492(-)